MYVIEIDGHKFKEYDAAKEYYLYIIHKNKSMHFKLYRKDEVIIDEEFALEESNHNFFGFVFTAIQKNIFKKILGGKDSYEDSEKLTELEKMYVHYFQIKNDINDLSIDYSSNEDYINYISQDEINIMADMCALYDIENGELKNKDELALEYMAIPVEELVFQFEQKYGYDYHVQYYNDLSKSDNNLKHILDKHIKHYLAVKNDLNISKENKNTLILERKKKNV